MSCPVKKFKGRTPEPSEYPSRPSFDIDKNKLKAEIAEAPRNHEGAKRRALIRDNWRCVITDLVDREAPADVIDNLDPRTVVVGVDTECAHIIPEAIFFDVDKFEANLKLSYFAFILAVLKRFCYDIGEFNGEKVHTLTNVMSMQKDVHNVFDKLELYFEATPQENCYEVKWFRLKPHGDIRQFVTFSTTDPVNLPVPSPELLTLHATCCKVAHFSGASQYIDEIYRDMEMIGVLSADGASSDMLNYRLSSLPNHTVSARG